MKAAVIFVNSDKVISEIPKNDYKAVQKALLSLNITLDQTEIIDAEFSQIKSALSNFITGHDFIFFVGGMGVESRDITKTSVASALELDLVVDKDCLSAVEKYCIDNRIIFTDAVKKNAVMPVRAHVFNNSCGVTPGCAVNHDGAIAIMLPGNTHELKKMLSKSVVPFLKKLARKDCESKKAPLRVLVYKIAIAVFALILVVSGVLLILQTREAKMSTDDYLYARSVARVPPNKDRTPVDEDIPKLEVDFEGLMFINPDTIGYVAINGTNISFPVTQTTNNYYYLDHTFFKKKSYYGCIFADTSSKITKEETSQNIILYGHRLNNGEMFSQLGKYLDVEFYRQNPFIYFNTIYSADIWKVFAVYEIDPKEVTTEFNYMQTDFDSDGQFLEFIKRTKSHSFLDIPVSVNKTDRLLTLSTCTYDKNPKRLVVVAKRVRDGENMQIELDMARNK